MAESIKHAHQTVATQGPTWRMMQNLHRQHPADTHSRERPWLVEEAARYKSGPEGKVAFRPMEKGEESLSPMRRCSMSLIIRGKKL